VNHDREFVSSLATQNFEIADGGIEHFVGTYDAYLAHKDAQAA
jgi:ATPase subunit of ABC transporter with duplicated ATPase domains